MKINIAYLYPDIMNIYGDRGNIICLTKRCLWRGIKVKVTSLSLGDKIDPEKYDLYFAGGGQDRQQILVSEDLPKKEKALRHAAEIEVPMLTICGSYQLFGHYFKPFSGKKLPGISIFDAYTVASKKRKIGNIVVELDKQLQSLIKTSQPCHSELDSESIGIDSHFCGNDNCLVGFENHSGNTFIEKNSQTKPLGKVIKGFGNNGEDKTEGAVCQNVFGCYLHGSLLPKNPHFADHLIRLALKRRYDDVKLKPLDDSLEWQTHKKAMKL